ncbi:DUF4382 domain-containing protein [Geotalea sp. SG265]|uniref:DUF4382 domain-containing protein n=1 Tax=Geotalea sp. SG265 TaxID=2922867 RepID=UPI001FB02D79|nr:DUF4382 domain-containing protein [Geotalea sp. SG265]
MKQARPGLIGVILLFIAMTTLLTAGCGGGGGGGAAAPSGTASIHITDAPDLNYDHVWITVTEAWFHKLDTDDLTDTGWIKFPLATPRTIDLASLSAGQTQEVWSGLKLPAGKYGQIRVFLAPTEGPAKGSLPSGVTFNNEVDFTDGTGSHKAPLRIPSPAQGIKVVPETPIVVTSGDLKLALDFNVGEDVVEIFRQGQMSSAQNLAAVPTRAKEFILKARLRYFDMNSAGALTGTVAPPATAFGNASSAFRNISGAFTNLSSSFRTAFKNYTGKNFTVKAEQVNPVTSLRQARRSTTIDNRGRFTLYPLPVFGTATTATYDLVIRGRNVETIVINGVKVHKGSSPDKSTAISNRPIRLTTGSEYAVNVNAKPAGAAVTFYQTLPTDPVPYEIRFRHIDPFSTTGSFSTPIELSSGPLHVGAFSNGGPITLTSVTPTEGQGVFFAIATAELFNPSPRTSVSSLTPLIAFSPLAISAPAEARTISGKITVKDAGLDQGIMLITHGGTLVDTLDLSDKVKVGDNPYTTGKLPGGTTAAPLSGALYDLFVLGWSAAQPDKTTETGSAAGVNLKTDNGTANITMSKL